MTVRMRTEPTAAEVSNWNRQARQPATTWVRTGYNAYLTLQKCSYLWTAIKCAEPGNLVRVGFQTLAVPLAERTGSETVKKCAYVASEGIGAIFTPISWATGKACQWIGSQVAQQVTHHLDIQNPELRDLVDIAASELSTYSAGKISKRIEQARTPIKVTKRTIRFVKPATNTQTTSIGKQPPQRPVVHKPPVHVVKKEAPTQPKIVSRIRVPSVGKRPPENVLNKKPIERKFVPQVSTPKKVITEDQKGKSTPSLGSRILKKPSEAAAPKKTEQPKVDLSEQASACTVATPTSAEIAAAQKRVDSANQKVLHMGALAGYSHIDIENVAKEVYNNARNEQLKGSLLVPTIEKQLSDKYGIPVGTLTDSLTNAFASRNPDSHITKRIQEALAAQQTNGHARAIAQQDLDVAKTTLQQIKEPTCTTALPTQPIVSVPRPSNILELVNDSANVARQNGLEDNVFVQMRYLATTLTGSDHGEQYENAYSSFYEGYAKWQSYRGDDKPTQSGFLTAVTDVLVNGASTVPVETKNRPWYQSALQFAGSNGIGFQLNGNNLQLGTMAQPNLVSVSTDSLPFATSLSSTAGHTVANGIGEAVKNLDHKPGLEGLGTYIHGTIEKVTAVIGTMERIEDPDFQHEPGGQRIGCAIWGTAVEKAGEAIVVPLTGVAAVVAGAAITPFSEMAGDDAQQNCHDVVNMGRDFVNKLTH